MTNALRSVYYWYDNSKSSQLTQCEINASAGEGLYVDEINLKNKYGDNNGIINVNYTNVYQNFNQLGINGRDILLYVANNDNILKNGIRNIDTNDIDDDSKQDDGDSEDKKAYFETLGEVKIVGGQSISTNSFTVVNKFNATNYYQYLIWNDLKTNSIKCGLLSPLVGDYVWELTVYKATSDNPNNVTYNGDNWSNVLRLVISSDLQSYKRIEWKENKTDKNWKSCDITSFSSFTYNNGDDENSDSDGDSNKNKNSMVFILNNLKESSFSIDPSLKYAPQYMKLYINTNSLKVSKGVIQQNVSKEVYNGCNGNGIAPNFVGLSVIGDISTIYTPIDPNSTIVNVFNGLINVVASQNDSDDIMVLHTLLWQEKNGKNNKTSIMKGNYKLQNVKNKENFKSWLDSIDKSTVKEYVPKSSIESQVVPFDIATILWYGVDKQFEYFVSKNSNTSQYDAFVRLYKQNNVTM